MRTTRTSLLLAALLAVPAAFAAAAGEAPKAAAPDWSIQTTVIEACSCPMFCQCYFNDNPAAHGGHEGHEGHGAKHFCKFNNAYKITKGHHGKTDLAGAKFWMAGDLGAGEFSKGKMDWVVVTFDRATTPAQREAIQAIAGAMFPVTWNSLTTAEGDIEWSANKDSAVATLDGGKTAEVRLVRFPGMTDEPVVIKNLKYWGVPRNEGFVLMPNQVEAWKKGDQAFEYKGTNGFMLTMDMSSKDLAPASKDAKPAGGGN